MSFFVGNGHSKNIARRFEKHPYPEYEAEIHQYLEDFERFCISPSKIDMYR